MTSPAQQRAALTAPNIAQRVALAAGLWLGPGLWLGLGLGLELSATATAQPVSQGSTESQSPSPNESQSQWLIFAKRADQLLKPLDWPRAASDPTWQTSLGYRAGFYDSLLGYAGYLENFGYDAESFRTLTDSLMADDLSLGEDQVPAFLTAFFAIAQKVPSHNQRLQNLIVWFSHKVFAPYQTAIKLRLYQLYRQRQRLDLFPGKPLAVLAEPSSPPSLASAAPAAFARSSQLIREQIVADLLAAKRGLWAKAAFCASLSRDQRACYSYGLIASLKINRQRWITKLIRQRQALEAKPEPNEPISAALRIKVSHWLTYRGLYRQAAAEFAAWEHGDELPLNLQQLRLFLLVKTGAFEKFDALADKVAVLLGSEAAAWRQQLAAIENVAMLKAHGEGLFKSALDSYSFDPILPWHKHLSFHRQTAAELKAFGADLARLSQWQRLALKGHEGLRRDGDMVVASRFLDDLSAAIVATTLKEQRQHSSQIDPADRARLLQACRLILEQDSQFSRYTDAAKLLADSQRKASLNDLSAISSWQRTWQAYLDDTSAAALASPLPPAQGSGSERAFLSPGLFQQISAVQQVIADQRDAERRGLLWQQILTRQRALAHHATRIQLILEPYRDTLEPALDSTYQNREQLWHRIGAVLSTTYERTKAAIRNEEQLVARRQGYILKQSDALTAWHSDLGRQESALWLAFQQAQPNLLARFDTMILRQRKLLAKWRADRLAGRYLDTVGATHREVMSQDKLETLSSSLKTLKLATWLDWPIITRQ